MNPASKQIVSHNKLDVNRKKATLNKAAWMNQRSHPLPIFKNGDMVQVYRNQRWVKGKVLISTPGGCTVDLFQDSTTVNVYDARCICPTDD